MGFSIETHRNEKDLSGLSVNLTISLFMPLSFFSTLFGTHIEKVEAHTFRNFFCLVTC